MKVVKTARYALRAYSIARNLQVLGVSEKNSKKAVGVIIMVDALIALVGQVGQVLDMAVTGVMKRIIARQNAATVKAILS